MDYSACLDYLYNHLPMFSRTGPAALKMDLSNTLAICEALGNPQNKFKSIHIAGTNGKGSVSHMLASVFQACGFKTGLYTSPHLTDFRERIKVNGCMIAEENVVAFTEAMIPLIEKISPSFFELTVGMAFQHFAEENVDIAIIETGLGGRLDSTNIINPELSIITNIGFDHVALLGATLEKIASEKAGIIKAGIPVVIGEQKPETAHVFRKKAEMMNTDIHFADHLIDVISLHQDLDKIVVALLINPTSQIIEITSDLAGIYQRENIKTVAAAITILRQRGWNLQDTAIQEGMSQVIQSTGLHGRWELLNSRPAVIADVAHNPDGIAKLLQQIEATKHQKLMLILGMSNDKDVTGILQLLPSNAYYCFTQASIPRAMHCSDLSNLAQQFGLKGRPFNNVNDALSHCMNYAKEEDLIVVCGSVFVVGEIDKSRFLQ
jgi:dihydrofolate synthase/folylpolyglutamate synthase